MTITLFKFLTNPTFFDAIYFNIRKTRMMLYVTQNKFKFGRVIIGLGKEIYFDSITVFIQLSFSFRTIVRFLIFL